MAYRNVNTSRWRASEILAISVVISLAACRPTEVIRADSVNGHPAVSPAELDVVPINAAYGGQLDKPIKDYEQDPVAFYRLVRSRSWYGWDRPRLCEGDPRCDGPKPTLSTWARVQAIDDASMIDADPSHNKIPPNGVVVARLMNVGYWPEKHYKLPTGNDETYIIVQPTPNGTGYQQNFAVLSFPGGRPKLKVKDIAAPFSACPPHSPTPATKYADFKPCPSDLKGRAVSEEPYLDSDAWLSCVQGCCTSLYPLHNAKSGN